jgi:interferon gamma-inducible protein 30
MLQQLAAQRTASLKPPHRWVPWVTVNGIPLLDDVDSIQRYICTVIYHTVTVRDRYDRQV